MFPDKYDERYIDAIELNGMYNVQAPLKFEKMPKLDNKPPEELIVDRTTSIDEVCVDVIQEFVDKQYGNTIQDTEHLSELVQYGPIELILANCTIDLSKLHPTKYDKLTDAFVNVEAPPRKVQPVLRTPMPAKREKTLKETVVAFLKRNANVPQQQGLNDDDSLSSLMVQNFSRSYFDRNKLSLLHEYSKKPISLSASAIEAWEKQSGNKAGSFHTLGMAEKPLHKYDYMIKTDVKPDLTVAHGDSYKALQTIAYHSKQINAIFSPLFKQARIRLYEILSPRFIIFGDMSVEEFENKLNTWEPQLVAKFEAIMVDISKFDKSQQRMMRKFEKKLFRLLGFPEQLLDIWYRCHGNTILRAKDAGFRAKIQEQRKSGDANTFFGNTVFAMAVLAMAVDMRKVLFAVFGGDDSLIVGKGIQIDRSDIFSNTFNLEAKCFFYRYFYFCSRWIVPVNNRWKVVPDVLKLVVKLGRTDIRDLIHLEEYRRSLADLMVNAKDWRVDDYIDKGMYEMYSLFNPVSAMLTNLCKAIYYPSEFAKLFITSEPLILEPRHRKKIVIASSSLREPLRNLNINSIEATPRLIDFLSTKRASELGNILLLLDTNVSYALQCETYYVQPGKVGVASTDLIRKKFNWRSYDCDEEETNISEKIVITVKDILDNQ